jgi:protocatechuate 3,4-dioxygenase beta subunit
MDLRPYNPEAADQPPSLHPPYASTVKRSPRQPLVPIPQTLTEVTGPGAVWERLMGPALLDMTRQHKAEPIGQRIVISGRVLDEDARPAPHTVVEVWQANAAGRYAHLREQHPAPLDPNFTGVGRTLTDDEGRYEFITVKPGAYPWGNHTNAWRPAHIHFSVFGTAFTQRLITQMYFPADPLFPYDPILHSVTDRAARERLIAAYDHGLSRPEWSMGYRWDIVLDGPSATWIEEGR